MTPSEIIRDDYTPEYREMKDQQNRDHSFAPMLSGSDDDDDN